MNKTKRSINDPFNVGWDRSGGFPDFLSWFKPTKKPAFNLTDSLYGTTTSTTEVAVPTAEPVAKPVVTRPTLDLNLPAGGNVPLRTPTPITPVGTDIPASKAIEMFEQRNLPARTASTVVAPTLPNVPAVTAPPEPGTELPYNNAAWLLGKAAQAVMGPFQDTVAAQIGGTVAEFSERKAQATYISDVLAGRQPLDAVSKLVSPEVQLQAREMREQNEDRRVARQATLDQLALDKAKLEFENKKFEAEQTQFNKTLEQRQTEFKLSQEHEAALAKLNREMQIKVAELYTADRQSEAERALSDAVDAYRQTYATTMGDETAAMAAFNLRLAKFPELQQQVSTSPVQTQQDFTGNLINVSLPNKKE